MAITPTPTVSGNVPDPAIAHRLTNHVHQQVSGTTSGFVVRSHHELLREDWSGLQDLVDAAAINRNIPANQVVNFSIAFLRSIFEKWHTARGFAGEPTLKALTARDCTIEAGVWREDCRRSKKHRKCHARAEEAGLTLQLPRVNPHRRQGAGVLLRISPQSTSVGPILPNIMVTDIKGAMGDGSNVSLTDEEYYDRLARLLVQYDAADRARTQLYNERYLIWLVKLRLSRWYRHTATTYDRPDRTPDINEPRYVQLEPIGQAALWTRLWGTINKALALCLP